MPWELYFPGFRIKAGEARHGEYYKLKGVIHSTRDIKMSSAEPNGGIAVFEQTVSKIEYPFGLPSCTIMRDQNQIPFWCPFSGL